MTLSLEVEYRLNHRDIWRLVRNVYTHGHSWMIGAAAATGGTFLLGGVFTGIAALTFCGTAVLLIGFAVLLGFYKKMSAHMMHAACHSGHLFFQPGEIRITGSSGELRIPLDNRADVYVDGLARNHRPGLPPLEYRRYPGGIVIFDKTVFRPLFYLKPSDFAQADGIDRLEDYLRENKVQTS